MYRYTRVYVVYSYIIMSYRKNSRVAFTNVHVYRIRAVAAKYAYQLIVYVRQMLYHLEM
jgi:hypothetical protein